MVVYEESYAVSQFTKSAIKIDIPRGTYIYMIEINALKSKWGHYFDICIMDSREILFAGPLAQNIKQINVPKWLSVGSSIYICLTPNKHLLKVNGPWMAFNENVIISFKGYGAIPEIDCEVLWDDEEFKEEWS